MATTRNKDGMDRGLDISINSPAVNANSLAKSFTIVPSDTVMFDRPVYSIYCGGAGIVRLIKPDGTTQDYTVVVSNVIYARAEGVMATGTTVLPGLLVAQY